MLPLILQAIGLLVAFVQDLLAEVAAEKEKGLTQKAKAKKAKAKGTYAERTELLLVVMDFLLLVLASESSSAGRVPEHTHLLACQLHHLQAQTLLALSGEGCTRHYMKQLRLFVPAFKHFCMQRSVRPALSLHYFAAMHEADSCS